MVKKLTFYKSIVFIMMWPILVELIVNGLISNVNQSILNEFSNDAVAVVGSGAQMPTIIINIYGIISLGTSIILAKLIGGKKIDECNRLMNASLIMNTVLGFILSLLGVILVPWMIQLINIPIELEGMAREYLLITIGFSFLQAILNTLISIFRSLGYMKKVTITLILINVICLILNKSIILFIREDSIRLLHFACTGSIAHVIGIIIFYIMLRKDSNIDFQLRLKSGIEDIKLYISKILRIGIPGGLEGIIYLLGQTVIISFIGMLGSEAMFTRALVGNITYYMSLVTSTVSTVSSVIIGQLLGAGKIEEIKSTVRNNIRLTISVTTVICIVLVILGPKILSIYSMDKSVIENSMNIIMINVILELFRCVAAILIVVLKAVGDVDFPFVLVIFGVIVNIAVSYYFGVHMGLGLVGIWIGYIFDVGLRGIACLLYWNKNKWMKYC